MTRGKRIKDSQTGRIRFSEDLYSKRMLTGRIVRSTIDYGAILGIRLPDPIPPGIFCILARDIPGKNFLLYSNRKIPLLASRNIRYRGEPIALVTGEDSRQVDEFIEGIQIDYSEEKSTNSIFRTRTLEKGNIKQAFESAERIIEGDYQTPTQEYRQPGLFNAYAVKEGESISVYTASQWPSHLRKSVERALGLQSGQLKFFPTRNSVSLDSRLFYSEQLAVYASLLAYASKKPVRIDALPQWGPRRLPTLIHHKTAVDSKGNIEGMKIEINADFGAYPFFINESLDRLCMAATGGYRCRHLSVSAHAWQSSQPPRGPFSGMGDTSSFYALEVHTSRIAEIFQVPPPVWKSLHFLKKDQKTAAGRIPGQDLPLEPLLKSIINDSDFNRKHAAYELQKKRKRSLRESFYPHRGIGISVAFQGADFIRRDREKISQSIIVRLETDGRLTIFLSTLPEHPELEYAWKEMITEILGIEENDISFRCDDGEQQLSSGPAVLSRNVVINTRLIQQACLQIKKRRFRDPLPITIQKSFRKPSSRPWNTEKMEGIPFIDQSWAAAVVEVSIDPISFSIHVDEIWLYLSAGRILSRSAAMRCLEEGVAEALGLCLYERPRNPGRLLYLPEEEGGLVGSQHLPPLSINLAETRKSKPPGGLGELAINTIPSALTTAVSQATGYYLDRLPITESYLYRLFREER